MAVYKKTGVVRLRHLAHVKEEVIKLTAEMCAFDIFSLGEFKFFQFMVLCAYA